MLVYRGKMWGKCERELRDGVWEYNMIGYCFFKHALFYKMSGGNEGGTAYGEQYSSELVWIGFYSSFAFYILVSLE